MVLRNPEAARFCRYFCTVSAIGVSVCFFLHRRAGFAALVLCLALFLLWYLAQRRNYQNMAKLAAEIDELLHSGRDIQFAACKEGELSLLETEISKLTVKLKEQSAQLEKDKSSLADAMADVSHQLRTSLTAMHLVLAAMGNDTTPQTLQSHRRTLRRHLERMDWLVSALLKLAKLDAGVIAFHPSSISLQDLVQKALDPLLVSMELHGQEVVTSLFGSLTCDPAWTTEALVNILKNCTEHMEAGILTITGSENPLYTQLCIQDTGPGVAPEDLPHLFERFYKGKNASAESVGIGLALTRSILAAQNGTVKVENAPEGGALFTIRFYKSVI